MKNIGVLLSGCGYKDGAEIREAVFTTLAIEQAGARPIFLSLNEPQFDTINHGNDSEEPGPTRNILDESQRISRGKSHDLEQYDISELSALVIPGGFGVAKSFCTFATEGGHGKVHKKIEKFLYEVHSQRKPIGAICIAPALLSLLFGKDGYSCTIGNDPGTAKAVCLTGAGHVPKEVTEIHHDKAMNIVSTPAYMYDDASSVDVFAGIKKCVDKVVELC